MKKSRDVTFYENYTYRDNHENPGRATTASISKSLIMPETGTSINFENTLLHEVIVKTDTVKDLAKDLPAQDNVANEPVCGRIQILLISAEFTKSDLICSIEEFSDYEILFTKYSKQDFCLAESEPSIMNTEVTAPRQL